VTTLTDCGSCPSNVEIGLGIVGAAAAEFVTGSPAWLGAGARLVVGAVRSAAGMVALIVGAFELAGAIEFVRDAAGEGGGNVSTVGTALLKDRMTSPACVLRTTGSPCVASDAVRRDCLIDITSFVLSVKFFSYF
jgi:hypothetical protein